MDSSSNASASMSDFFENPDIDLSSLPQARKIQFESLADTYFKTSLALWFLAVAIPGIIAILFITNVIPGLADMKYTAPVLTVMETLWLIAAILNLAEIKRRGFAVRRYDIAYKKGLIWQSVTIIPFSRVQHVETHRGPIDRAVGLSQLRVYTAGGYAADLSISGLSVKDASTLRLNILKQASEIDTHDSLSEQILTKDMAEDPETESSGEPISDAQR